MLQQRAQWSPQPQPVYPAPTGLDQLLPKAAVDSGAMVPVEIAPDGDRPRRTDREGIIEIAFGCGARVRLRGEVSSETLRQVIELLR
jgi:hypothetical protein